MTAKHGRLAGKVTIVTGGASGIGEAMSRLFAREGALVGIVDINVPAGLRLDREIREAGGMACFVKANVADEGSVAEAVKSVYERYGGLDVLVNNAGIGNQSSGDEEGWWRVLRINVMGVAWGMREAIRVLRAHGGGAIVNTGSHAGQRAARAGIYGCGKAAVHTLTRYAALAHAPDRVRVNAVLPGNIYTPIHDPRRHGALVRVMGGDASAFTTDPLEQGEEPEEIRSALLDEFHRIHPMGQLASVEDIAHAALYLVSDEARMVTGNEFLVNGGILAAQLRDRLRGALTGGNGAWGTPYPAGVTAIVSANSPVVEAFASGCERAGMPFAVSPNAALADVRALEDWLRTVGPVSGIVFAMRPDPGGDLASQGRVEWEEELAADLRVPWVLAHVARGLLPRGGAVTFVSDVAGLTGAEGSPAFCAAAAALIYATDELADMLREGGIRLNTVIAESTSTPTASQGLGAPARKADVAEVALAVALGSSFTGLQLNLETSHADA